MFGILIKAPILWAILKINFENKQNLLIMKKLTVLVAVVFMFGAVACKKDYTCSCTVSGAALTAEFKDAKKKDAEDACSALETTYKIADPAATCSL